MSKDQIIYFIALISSALIIYSQSLKIKQLKARINTLAKRTPNGKDERLAYLRENLAHLDKVKVIKALRERYPELSLVEANELWKQSQSNTKPLT